MTAAIKDPEEADRIVAEIMLRLRAERDDIWRRLGHSVELDVMRTQAQDTMRLVEIICWCQDNIGEVLDRWAPPDPGSLWREDRRAWRFASREELVLFRMVWQ